MSKRVVKQPLTRADRLVVYRIVAIYAFFSALWIYLSDKTVGLVVRDPIVIVRIAIYKGMLFIALTSFLLSQLITRHLLRVRQADRELRESRELLRAIIEGTSDAVYVKDLKGRYILFNAAASHFTGKTAEEVVGHDDTVLFPGEEAETVMAGDRAVLAGGKTTTYEEVVTGASGELLTFLSTKGPVYDASGTVCGLFGIARDITGLKKANETLEIRVAERTRELEESRAELERHNEELRDTYYKLEKETRERIRAMEELREREHMLIQQSRMAAMGEMLCNIAHQWRQPLNVLGLKVQELKLSVGFGTFSEDLLRSNVDSVMLIVKRLSQTIDDFRILSHAEKEKTRFRVNETVRKAASLVEESFKEWNIALEVSTDGDPQITGFHNEYSQVLIDILMNARDAFQKKGRPDAWIAVRSWEENGKAIVTITDNAGGIREQIMDRIFDPYFTTKEYGKASGLGLFIAKTIIEKEMSGRLSARNVADGAEFRIEV